MTDGSTTSWKDPSNLALLALAAALNIGIGAVVGALKLPVYLDSIGTLLAAALGGWQAGLAVGLLGVMIGTILIAPTSWAYAGTAVVIAIAASALRRHGYLHSLLPTVLGGAVIGVLSAVVSAPVTTIVYGGISFAGADAVTLLFKSMGETLMTSVFLGGLATDPVDKIASSIVAMLVIRAFPPRLLMRFPHGPRFKQSPSLNE